MIVNRWSPAAFDQCVRLGAFFALLACCLSGCVQRRYSASSLPRQFAAKPPPDYSTVDLTTWASPRRDENQIQAGDRLTVRIDPGIGIKDAVETWTIGVSESGATIVPNIGAVQLGGLTKTEAENSIVQTSLSRDVYLTPAVDVSLVERPEHTIFVAGAVAQPGPVTVAQPVVSLADVILQVGGFTEQASGRITVSDTEDYLDGDDQLRTVSQASSPVDTALTLSLATTSRAELAAIKIPSGAFVSVEENPQQFVQVVGVIQDKLVELPAGQEVRLLDALTMAGGPTYSNWISDRVCITRQMSGVNKPIRISTSIRKAKKNEADNIVLAPMDIVNVEENVFTFMLSTLGGLTGLAQAARVAPLP